MKIELEISAGPGKGQLFEHSGPFIHIGRAPECELAVNREQQSAVSWKHARIELTADGAFIRDLESKNVGSSRVDLQACKLEYSIVSPK